MSGQIHQVIENSYLFSGLDQKLIGRIADNATTRSVGANELLFQKGDPADALWGVLSGRISIEMHSEDGKEMVLEAFEAGDVFGEVGVLDFGPRHVTATAEVPSRLFRLERKHFLEHLQSSPELCFRIFSLLCSQLRDTTETLEDTALYKFPNRLAKKLTSLSDENGSDNNDPQPVIHVVQSDLARMLGVNREAVNRHLREWEKRGWVSLKHHQIGIHDRQSLDDLAAPHQTVDRRSWGFPTNAAFPASREPAKDDRRTVSILAVDAAEYSGLLMTDAAGTLKRLRDGLTAVDKSISNFGGQLIWHAGDRVLAEFSNAPAAMQAALAIQAGTENTEADGRDPLFRIGIHVGGLVVSADHYLGEAINVAINLTTLATGGGILVSGRVRDELEDSASLELPFLGNHEFKNVSESIPVYSARNVPSLRSLYLRLDALLPRRFRPLYLGAVLILLVSFAWMTADRIGRVIFPLPIPVNSIAVLSFDPLGDDGSAYLGNGLAEEIRIALSGIAEFRVIGRTSSNYFVDRNVSEEEIGRTLQVAYVLRGTAGREGDVLNVSAQLIEASSGRSIWSHEYRGSWRQFAEFRNDIIDHVTKSLDLEPDNGIGSVLAVTATTNDEAYALFLRAQKITWIGHQRFAIDSIRLLHRAIELDPEFAEAHALLADVYMKNGVLLDRRPEYNPGLRRQLATESMRMAQELKPNSPFVLGKASERALGNDDVALAQRLAEAALSVNANDPAALSALVRVYFRLDDWVLATNVLERLLVLEPLSISTMSSYIFALVAADRYEEAKTIALRALALYPDDSLRHINVFLALCRNQLGDKVGAIESGRKGMPNGRPFDLWAGLDFDWTISSYNPLLSIGQLTYVRRYDEARQIIIDEYRRKATDPPTLDSLEYLVNRGELEALAGNFNQAIGFFEQARAQNPNNEHPLFRLRNYNLWFYGVLQSWPALALLQAYRQTGQDDEADGIAVRISEEIAKLRQIHRSVGARAEHKYLYVETQYHAIDGRIDEALATLRNWRQNDKMLFTYVKTDPLLENLHGIPEFHAIVAEVEAELAAVRAAYHARMAEQSAVDRS